MRARPRPTGVRLSALAFPPGPFEAIPQAECRPAECRPAECRPAECRPAECRPAESSGSGWEELKQSLYPSRKNVPHRVVSTPRTASLFNHQLA